MEFLDNLEVRMMSAMRGDGAEMALAGVATVATAAAVAPAPAPAPPPAAPPCVAAVLPVVEDNDIGVPLPAVSTTRSPAGLNPCLGGVPPV